MATKKIVKVAVKPRKTTKKKDYISSYGRRKTAIARVRLFEGRDEIIVNGLPISQYFPGEAFESQYLEPFRTTNTHTKYSATVKIIGSGKQSQLGALIHAVSKALVVINPERFKPILKKRGFLTRDPRMKETRKPGSAGSKARAKRQSPKR